MSEKDTAVVELAKLQTTINELPVTETRAVLQGQFSRVVKSLADADVLGPLRAGIELPKPAA